MVTLNKRAKTFRAAGAALFEELKQLSFKSLINQNGQIREILRDGNRFYFHVIVENNKQASLRIIVQGFLRLKWVPFLKHTFVDGFEIDTNDKKTQMTPEQLYDYE